MKIDLINKISKNFASNLINWYSDNKRSLPWRDTKDPYKIWLSEIILQQTQIKQGLPYYNKFIKLFPDVNSLSISSEQKVLKNWEGLGYYSRARNLHKASRKVVNEYDSKFPKTYEELITLPGIGDYSASAISSFSNNEIRPVLDGNVYRLISRLFEISSTINTTSSVKEFKKVLYKLISKNNPGDFNQAIMDFGSIVCRPKNPSCLSCIFNKNCLSFQNNTVFDFPVKKKKLAIKSRILNYLVVIDSNKKTIIKKRVKKDIWQNLYDFPLIESLETVNNQTIMDLLNSNYKSVFSFEKIYLDKTENHKLSHQNLKLRFWIIKVSDSIVHGVSINNLNNYPFPKPLFSFINTLDRFLM